MQLLAFLGRAVPAGVTLGFAVASGVGGPQLLREKGPAEDLHQAWDQLDLCHGGREEQGEKGQRRTGRLKTKKIYILLYI